MEVLSLEYLLSLLHKEIHSSPRKVSKVIHPSRVTKNTEIPMKICIWLLYHKRALIHQLKMASKDSDKKKEDRNGQAGSSKARNAISTSKGTAGDKGEKSPPKDKSGHGKLESGG